MALATWKGFDHKQRMAGSKIIDSAIRIGKLKPPSKCIRCGQTKGKILYHTDNYSIEQILNCLEEVCWQCHYRIHNEHRFPSSCKKYWEDIAKGRVYPARGFNYMVKHIRIAKLFREEPVQWGLRGDPYLWSEMEISLSSGNYPETATKFIGLFKDAFEKLTGFSIAHKEDIYIERYAHGGMSSGYVRPAYWRKYFIPLLRERYVKNIKAGAKTENNR